MERHEEPESPACTIDLAKYAAQHAVYADASKQMLRLDSMMNALGGGSAVSIPDASASRDDQSRGQDPEHAQAQQELARPEAVKNPLRVLQL